MQGRNNSWESCSRHFERFVKGSCTCSQVTLALCVGFREYLLSANCIKDTTKPLHKNSASGYYRKFRGLLAMAYRDKLLTEDMNPNLTRIEKKPAHIEFLTQQELLQLSQATCSISVLKRAGLFSCLTGLRCSDVEKLSWNDPQP